MLRYALLSVLTMLVFFSCSDKKTAVLRGEISTLQGAAPQAAHVHIFDLGGDPFKPISTVKVQHDGSFEIDMPQKQRLEAMVTAANHPLLRFPLMKRSNKDVQLKIVLQDYNYVKDFSGVKIVGDWNKYSWGAAEPMKRQKDSTFVFERKTVADTLGYQLLKITKENRSINGTMWDKLIYDGGGDYISVINVKDGRARVVFDPKKLKHSKEKNEPDIKIIRGDITMQPFIDIALLMQRAMYKRSVIAQSYFDEFKSLAGFSYRAPEVVDYLYGKMMQKQDTLLSKYAAMQIARFWSMNGRLRDIVLIELTGKLPITDKMWAAEPMLATRIFPLALGESRADSLFQKNLGQIDNKKVKAALYIYLGMQARNRNDLEKMGDYHKKITGLNVDLPGLSFFLDQLDPQKKILKGHEIPEFSYKLFDSKGKISKKSLLGSYYMMDFWATWCGPCVGEMPTLHKTFKKYKDSNFTILSLSYDRSKNDVRRFRNGRWKMPWNHVFLSAEQRDEAAKIFEVKGIPKPILVGPDGKIIASESELRGDNLERTLQKYLR